MSKKDRSIERIEKKIIEELQYDKKYHPFMFFLNHFSRKTSAIVGNPITFLFAFMSVFIWAISGKYFHYSDSWQLVVNTGTNVIAYLIVFLIQNTQNRDTEILNLKIDELIMSQKGARALIDLSELSDKELKALENEYLKIKDKRKKI